MVVRLQGIYVACDLDHSTLGGSELSAASEFADALGVYSLVYSSVVIFSNWHVVGFLSIWWGGDCCEGIQGGTLGKDSLILLLNMYAHLS